MDHVCFNVKSILCLLAVYTHLGVKSQLIAINQCTCPGQVVSFQCTIVGNGNTVYNVTGCPDQLTLLSTGFNDDTARRQCMNGAVRAYGVHANPSNMTFVSQLNITPSLNYKDMTVECYHEVRDGLQLIGRKTFSADPAPPNDIHVVSRNPLTFDFEWSEVPNYCGLSMSVQYEINAIDCGSCPKRVSDTYANCSGATTVNSCNFTVKTIIICESIVGLSSSEPVYVNNSATTAEIPTITSTVDEGLGLTFRESVMAILIVVLLLLVCLIVINVIIMIKAKPFFEQVGRHSPAQQNDIAANTINQEHMLLQRIDANIQNIMQNMTKPKDDESNQLQLKFHPMLERSINQKLNKYREAKVAMAKTTPNKDTTQYSHSLEESTNSVPPEPVGADENSNSLEDNNNCDPPEFLTESNV